MAAKRKLTRETDVLVGGALGGVAVVPIADVQAVGGGRDAEAQDPAIQLHRFRLFHLRLATLREENR